MYDPPKQIIVNEKLNIILLHLQILHSMFSKKDGWKDGWTRFRGLDNRYEMSIFQGPLSLFAGSPQTSLPGLPLLRVIRVQRIFHLSLA